MRTAARLRARHVLAARLQGVRVYIVYFDADEEPPGASSEPTASPPASIRLRLDRASVVSAPIWRVT